MEHRRERLDAKSDPLMAILTTAPFALFRRKLMAALVNYLAMGGDTQGADGGCLASLKRQAAGDRKVA